MVKIIEELNLKAESQISIKEKNKSERRTS